MPQDWSGWRNRSEPTTTPTETNTWNAWRSLVPDSLEPLAEGVGERVSDFGGAAKTAAMRTLDVIGRPQQALFGGILEGTEGAKAGFMGEKQYSGEDLLTNLGIKDNPYYAKSIAGLGIDLLADPLNLVPLTPLAKGVGTVGKLATRTLQHPKIKPLANAVRPLNDLDEVEGLRDFARLAESGQRSVIENANEQVLKTLSPDWKGWRSKLPDQPTLKNIAYAVDEGRVNQLNPTEQSIANKFKLKMDEQWQKEVRAGQQQPQGQLANYVPYMTKSDIQRNVSVAQDVTGVTRHARDRQLPNLRTAVQTANATDDLSEILRKRLVSGDMAIHHAETVSKAAGQFAAPTAIDPTWRKLDFSSQRKVRMPNQALNMTVQTANGPIALKDAHFPKKVADYLEKAHVLWNQEEDVANLWKKAVTGWKSWVLLTPQQHATNFLGNIYNAYVHGDLSIPEQLKLVPEAGLITNGRKRMPAVGRYSAQQVEKLAKKYEVVGTAGRYENVTQQGKTYNLNPLSGNNIASKGSMHFSQHMIEEPFRLAVFLKHLRSGKSAEEAALAVKDVFFDYSEITPQIKFLRDSGLSPFITWMSKNIPLQVESTLKHPERLARVESTIDWTQDQLGADDTIVPKEDVREGMLATGTSSAHRVPLPLFDLNKLPIGDYGLSDARNDWLGGMAPQWKMPLELFSGHKMYGKEKPYPIDNYGKLTKPFDITSQLLAETPLAGLAGIEPTPEGPMQDPLMAYLMSNLPINYYNKILQLQKDREDGVMDTSKLDHLLGLLGARSKVITPKVQTEELQRRLKNAIMEP
jgi:hypothetical protein